MTTNSLNPKIIRARQAVLACQQCELGEAANRVPMRLRTNGGPRGAIVGEAPGREEDRLGQPFRGPSGKVLDEALVAAGVEQGSDAFFVLNAVSCWPHGTPSPAHVDACNGHLWRQLTAANPDKVLVLGRVAVSAMWGRGAPSVTALRGQWRQVSQVDRTRALVTWHPAAVLRAGKKSPRADEFRSDVATWVQA